jgi:hypothetical protein
MAIRKWHVGKIVLLWAWGVILCAIIVATIIGTKEWSPGPGLGLILVLTLLAILITLSVITWKWFGGKEQ